MTEDLPEFREWSIAAVSLLQGVVYADDAGVWGHVLDSRSTLEGYFGRLGLRLVVDESEGFAYLRQPAADELPPGYDRLPKLFHRTRLSYDATLLCVLLREELRRFEEDQLRDERCIMTAREIFERWKPFFPVASDEVKLKRQLDSTLRMLEDMKFVRRLSTDADEWEIRRILKARVPAAELENLREQLLAAVRQGQRPDPRGEADA